MEHASSHLQISLGADLGFDLIAPLVASGRSTYQSWEVREHAVWGRLYCLDGELMAAQQDAFVYHEWLIHPALLSQQNPRRVLILGGGDGLSAHEALKYPAVEIDIAELDPAVLQMAADHLAVLNHGALDDQRVSIHIGDAGFYLQSLDAAVCYDLIVFDLTDPGGLAEHLYQTAFFERCARHLTPHGVLTLHLGSPVYQRAQVHSLLARLRQSFHHVCPLYLAVPSYGGLWGLAAASKGLDVCAVPVDTLKQQLARLCPSLRAYRPELQYCAQFLPPYLDF